MQTRPETRRPGDRRRSEATSSGGRSLEEQVEAAAGGRSEGLLGVVAEVGVLDAATDRGKREGARDHVTHPAVGQRKVRVAAVHAVCGDVGGSGALPVCAGCVWGVRG